MNNELIKITENNGKKAVSARELHQFLGSKQEFANWIKNRIEKYQFIENQDFEVFDNFVKNPNGGRPLTEYALSIDMAKELAMIENNERGRMARKYFIECERKLGSMNLPSYQIADPIERARKWIEEEEERQRLSIELSVAIKKIEYQRNEIASRKEIIKGQHEEILDMKEQKRQLQKKNRKLSEKVAEDESKVRYFYQCAEAANSSLLSFRQTAAILSVKEKEFINVLHYVGIVYFTNNGPMPYARYLDKGYFRVVDGVAKNGKYFYQAKITTEGREYFNENWDKLRNVYSAK